MAALYRSYVFKTKDPAIDELRTVMEDHYGRRVTKKDSAQIASDGGPKAGTINGWFFGKTQRPQSATLEAAGRALGYKRSWVKMNGKGQVMSKQKELDEALVRQGLLRELDTIRAGLCNIQANSLNLAARIVNIMNELKEKNDD